MRESKNMSYTNHASFIYQDRLARAGDKVGSLKAIGKSSEFTSWEGYRSWLVKVQSPEQQRSVSDVALFSWKGYRSWADKIRRDWSG